MKPSNPRFVNKGKKALGLAELNALVKFYEAGGVIKVSPKVKRPKRGYTIGTPKSKAKG